VTLVLGAACFCALGVAVASLNHNAAGQRLTREPYLAFT
jgi:hypothetical protein